MQKLETYYFFDVSFKIYQVCVRQVPLKSLDQFHCQGCKFKGAYKVDKNIPSDINTLRVSACTFLAPMKALRVILQLF